MLFSQIEYLYFVSSKAAFTLYYTQTSRAAILKYMHVFQAQCNIFNLLYTSFFFKQGLCRFIDVDYVEF